MRRVGGKSVEQVVRISGDIIRNAAQPNDNRRLRREIGGCEPSCSCQVTRPTGRVVSWKYLSKVSPNSGIIGEIRRILAEFLLVGLQGGFKLLDVDRDRRVLALIRALFSATSESPTSMPMIMTTTSSSTSVKPCRGGRRLYCRLVVVRLPPLTWSFTCPSPSTSGPSESTCTKTP